MRYKYDFLRTETSAQGCSEDDDNTLSNDNVSSDSNSDNADIDSDSTIVYNRTSYARSKRHLRTENSTFFYEQSSKMHRKILSKHSVGMKKLMSHDLSAIMDDDQISRELQDSENIQTFKDRKLTQRCPVKTHPSAVSSETRTKDLKSAYLDLESRKKNKLLSDESKI